MFGSRHIAPGMLAAYMDAELGPDEQKLVEDHLASCPSCYEKALRQGRTAQIIRDAVSIALPQGAAAVPLMKSPDNSPVQSQPRSVRSRWGSVLSLIVLVFILIYGLQSLVSDMLARRANANTGRVSTYVEDHISVSNAYKATNGTGTLRTGVQP